MKIHYSLKSFLRNNNQVWHPIVLVIYIRTTSEVKCRLEYLSNNLYSRKRFPICPPVPTSVYFSYTV